MHTHTWFGAIAAVAGVIATGTPALAQGLDAKLGKDRAEIVSALAGRWVNELQIFFAGEAGVPDDEAPVHQDWTFAPGEDEHALDVSGGGSVFATMTFAIDAEAGVVRSTATNAPEGCTLAWRREADAFDAAAEGACGEEGVARILLNGDFMRLERRDGGPAFEMRRARTFQCWASVLRGASHGDAGAGAAPGDWWFTRDVTLHDQGGLATLTTDEEPARDIDLRLRRVEWPYGRNRPSLTLYVHQDQDERATSYAWAEYDAERIGINLRWVQASCTHTPR
ncbi:MAG: hypothetical protein MI723_19965 [Caulobacterales bacterium]|nr:hypothetical protein [Caulobacterales bacterium]